MSKAEAQQGFAEAEEIAVSYVELSEDDWAVLHAGRGQDCVLL